MAFIPKSKDTLESKIKNYLMNGFVLRCDGRDETPIEVLDRSIIKQLPMMGNIGQLRGGVLENIVCSHSILYSVLKELHKDYSVKQVFCACSGCCQYSTWGYYLDGEE